jgi:hypothetical protein
MENNKKTSYNGSVFCVAQNLFYNKNAARHSALFK